MKNTLIQLATLALLLSAVAACGNQNGHTPVKDTTSYPSPATVSADTVHTDSMINNGERLQGTDTSARHK